MTTMKPAAAKHQPIGGVAQNRTNRASLLRCAKPTKGGRRNKSSMTTLQRLAKQLDALGQRVQAATTINDGSAAGPIGQPG